MNSIILFLLIIAICGTIFLCYCLFLFLYIIISNWNDERKSNNRVKMHGTK